MDFFGYFLSKSKKFSFIKSKFSSVLIKILKVEIDSTLSNFIEAQKNKSILSNDSTTPLWISTHKKENKNFTH